VQLKVPCRDGDRRNFRWIGRIGAYQHQRFVGTVEDAEVETVRCAGFTEVHRTRSELDRTKVCLIAAIAFQCANALKINVVEVRFRRCGTGRTARNIAAGDDFDIEALEMEVARVPDNVPIATAGGRRAAARINNAAETERGLAFSFLNGTPASQTAPAGRDRRNVGNAVRISDQEEVRDDWLCLSRGKRDDWRQNLRGAVGKGKRMKERAETVGKIRKLNGEQALGGGPIGVLICATGVRDDNQHAGHGSVTHVQYAVVVGVTKYPADAEPGVCSGSGGENKTD